MHKLIGISVITLSFVAGCEQRSTSSDRPVNDPLAPSSTAPARTPMGEPSAAPTPSDPMAPSSTAPASTPSSTMPGRGEGEAEQAISESALPERYHQELMSDPALAESANSTQLITENGQLVLRGTAASEGLKTALADIAKALADGREVKNEIVVISE